MNPTDRAKHSASHDTFERRTPSRANNQTKTSFLEQRRNKREASLKKRTTQADKLKEEGNCHFRAGRHVEAIAKYNEAAKMAGLRPLIMSNLAAAYLKLEQYELAEWACDCALLYSPAMAKARFRRAMSRKAQGMNKGAELDLLVVEKHHPDIKEVSEELLKVRLQRKMDGDGQRAEPTYDEEFPLFNGKEWDPPLHSDSEDSKHTGNKRPCKFYNRGACREGLRCDFSHAPDDNSVRDNLGRNVCFNFLLDRCKQVNRCSYSHNKSYLGGGWWSSTTEVCAAIRLHDSLGDLAIDAHSIITLENTSLYGRLKKARDYQSDFDSYSSLTPDVLKSRIKDKAQNTANSSNEHFAQNDRFVLLLCFQNEELLDDVNGHLLVALRTKVKLVRARNAMQVLTYLEAPELAGAIVTDGGIMDQRNSDVVHKLVDYVKKGGSVVFSCMFPSFVSPSDLNRLFPQYFGLDWKYGSYFRTDFFKNLGNDIVKKNPSLENSYSMKAVHIQGMTAASALYSANETSFTQSLVFSSTPVTKFYESPAVTERVGKGWVSFMGDVNAEESSTNTILAMLGLLDAPLHPVPSPTKEQKLEEEQVPDGSKKAVDNKKGKKEVSNASDQTQPLAASALSPTPRSSIRSLRPDSSAMPFPPSTSSVTSTPSTPSNPSRTIRTHGAFHNARKSNSTHDGHFIMQLTLEYEEIVDQMCKSQLDAIRVKMDVKKVTSDAHAFELLASPHLRGIFATDPGLTNPRHGQLLERLVDYVSSGGCLVFGGTFGCFVRFPDVEQLFSGFNLNWKSGAYTRESLIHNLDDNELVETNIFLPNKICIKALFLSDVDTEEMLYTPISGVNHNLSPIACAHVQSGSVGFIGDVNAASCTTPSLLAMLQLLQPSQAIAKPLPHKFIVVFTYHDTIDEYEQTSLFLELKEKRVEIITDVHLTDPRIADLLSSRDLLGILVLDDIFSALDREWLKHQVAAYAWSGGTVILGGDFGLMTPPDYFEMFLAENFCLPWKVSSATELSVQLNENNALIGSTSHVALQEHVYSEGAFIYDVSPEAMIYRSQSGLGPESTIHVSTAYAEVGKGHVAYFGHEEIKDVDTTLMLMMLKL